MKRKERTYLSSRARSSHSYQFYFDRRDDPKWHDDYVRITKIRQQERALRARYLHREKIAGGVFSAFLGGIIITVLILSFNARQSNVVSEDTASTPTIVRNKRDRQRSVKEPTDQDSENSANDSSRPDVQESESRTKYSDQASRPKIENNYHRSESSAAKSSSKKSSGLKDMDAETTTDETDTAKAETATTNYATSRQESDSDNYESPTHKQRIRSSAKSGFTSASSSVNSASSSVLTSSTTR